MYMITQVLLRLFSEKVKTKCVSYFATKSCCEHGKCPKFLYTKIADKMAYANSADPDQTAPERAV